MVACRFCEKVNEGVSQSGGSLFGGGVTLGGGKLLSLSQPFWHFLVGSIDLKAKKRENSQKQDESEKR